MTGPSCQNVRDLSEISNSHPRYYFMKNNSHNLLHHTGRVLDFVSRRCEHYLNDADEAGCKECREIWEKLLEDYKRHIEMLRKEIERHAKEGSLD